VGNRCKALLTKQFGVEVCLGGERNAKSCHGSEGPSKVRGKVPGRAGGESREKVLFDPRGEA